MKYCRLCVQPDTRPGLQFDEEGVCPACRFAAQRFEIDWDTRKEELRDIIAWGRAHSHFGYDCIIGVSGGKDSTRQAMYVREELGAKPLLVSCTYPPEQMTHRGAHNLSNLIELGFDAISVGPGPQVWKRLMRYGFLQYGNWCKSTELALYTSAPKIATAYQIPLVFLGENPAITLGDFGVRSLTSDANRMKHGNTLAGADPSQYFVDGLTRKDLLLYSYPTDEEMNRAELRIRYLGYYWPDFSKLDNASYAIANGLHLREEPFADCGSVSKVQSVDEDFVAVNQMMKHLKLGFGMTTDDVCEDIRYGRMSREEAVELVKRYDGKCAPSLIERFSDYIEISVARFWDVAESFRNPALWRRRGNGAWELADALE